MQNDRVQLDLNESVVFCVVVLWTSCVQRQNMSCSFSRHFLTHFFSAIMTNDPTCLC